jgi:hypothetical protein
MRVEPQPLELLFCEDRFPGDKPMARIMPTQAVQTIDEMFPNAAKNEPNAMLSGNNAKLLGILNLLKDIPGDDYSDLVLATSAIGDYLAYWRARGNAGFLSDVKGFDAVTVIRRVLAKCPDEYPPRRHLSYCSSKTMPCGRASDRILVPRTGH